MYSNELHVAKNANLTMYYLPFSKPTLTWIWDVFSGRFNTLDSERPENTSEIQAKPVS